MNRVLVTGGTGFIASRLCRFLAGKGCRVWATFRPGSPVPALGQVEWRAVEEIGPRTDWREALEGIDCVFHIAGLAHRREFGSVPLARRFFRVNRQGTRRLAECAAQSPSVRRVVFLSSAAAVASSFLGRIDETAECRPGTAYGRSKLAAERALAGALAGKRADWCVLRPPLVYGPDNPGNMGRLLRLIRSGLPLPLRALRTRRSFLFVDNLLDALAACGTHPAAGGRIFFVSDGVDLSTGELVGRLAALSGTTDRSFSFPPAALRAGGRLGDALSCAAGRPLPFDSYAIERLAGGPALDISAIRGALGWSPPFGLEEGLAALCRGEASGSRRDVR